MNGGGRYKLSTSRSRRHRSDVGWPLSSFLSSAIVQISLFCPGSDDLQALFISLSHDLLLVSVSWLEADEHRG